MNQPDPFEYTKMLGDGLPGDRELLAQPGRGAAALGQQQVQHPTPGRVSHRRPQVVVDGSAHGFDTVRAA
ncbi:hypothetical protein BJY14_007962 [Actinomadura luteofluorescens]|uniref:Uncharacterized protein n=1 Tax=Actinomadura luteofluorescens TaxID=46163 RepID=A0A7Y9EQK8_9ACTN|nr:hypothetical protein [Actinomadura luteofluorescens]NYD51979.1 hypothetical protein [Actinomadura luteofluorescens]